MLIQKFGAGIFVIHDFLSKQECQEHIRNSEQMGYSQAYITTEEGEATDKGARNNDRIIYEHPTLAGELLERARPWLPADIHGWQPYGFNERFRFYRYQSEQFFTLHLDGAFRRHPREESFLTVIMYLNDDFDGGNTDFVWEKSLPQQEQHWFFHTDSSIKV